MESFFTCGGCGEEILDIPISVNICSYDNELCMCLPCHREIVYRPNKVHVALAIRKFVKIKHM